jgi:ATP-dependent metalloprotease FtsH
MVVPSCLQGRPMICLARTRISSQGVRGGILGLRKLQLRTRVARLRRRGRLGCGVVAASGGGEDEDYITKLLSETPSQVESKYLVGDRFYTLKELRKAEEPVWKGATDAVWANVVQPLLERRRAAEEDVVPPPEGEKPRDSVYLNDLLRGFQGNLYVPEEVFESRTDELEDYAQQLESLPEMSFEEFLRAARAREIEMLVSRGVTTPEGKHEYYDFLVELKRVPGEPDLQVRKRAMHLTRDEAEVALKECKGDQVEIESRYSPYVQLPSEAPNPVAAAISGRLMMEITVVASLVGAAALSVGGMASAVLFTATGIVSFLILRVLWPLSAPFIRPLIGLVAAIGRNIGYMISDALVGGKGARLFPGIRDMIASGTFYQSIRTLGAIIFVLVAMAALAKFTLTRRPKDFTKWDLWQAIEFGQSKPQARVEGSTGVGFADVAGIDDVVTELQELVSYLKDPERFNQMGTKPPHGVLLEGPPGCGKTLLAKAIAGEAGVPFYQMAGSEFVEVLVGVGAARIRDLFKRAKVNRPSVVFIDEIDALGAMRHGAAGEEGMESYNAGAQERETTLNQLLIELDGFDTGKGVVFLGATNRMDMLDPALLRPGRFDRKVAIRPPRAKGRYEILKVHAKSVKLDESVNLELYAKNLPGWSGAELAQLLQEAALVAVRHGGTIIERVDMDRALDRLTMGPERIGMRRCLPVHRRMASHELGLALTSHLLRHFEQADTEFCDRVSIVPRGDTLARCIMNRLEDEYYLFERRPALLHRLQVLLGGRASSYSLTHLPDAAWLARKIVSTWNLEKGITLTGDPCPWGGGGSPTGPPLGFEGGLYDDYGFVQTPLNYDLVDDTMEQTQNLIESMYMKTLKLLKKHHAALAKAVCVVMEREELFGEEIEQILELYPAGTPVQSVMDEEEPGDLPPLSESIKANIAEVTTRSELPSRQSRDPFSGADALTTGKAADTAEIFRRSG